MLPNSWKPINTSGMVLIGPKCDGGYVVTEAAAKAANLLVSMGVNDDWRFEEDFRKRTGASVVAYDGTVNWWFWTRHALRSIQRTDFRRLGRYASYRRFFTGEKVQHRKQMIGDGRNGTVSVSDILREFPDQQIFLKMDIEGSEYEVLDQIVAEQDRFAGIAMEWHEISRRRNDVTKFIAAMTTFSVVALHVNNWGGTDRNGDPQCLEMTLTQKRFVVTDETASVPTMPPNNLNSAEVELKYELA